MAHNNLGLALKARGQLAEARHHYETALEANPVYTESLNNLGLINAEAGNFQAAQKQFSKTLEIDPTHAVALHNLAKVKAALGANEQALALFDKAIEQRPSFAMAYYDKSYILIQQSRWQEAEIALRHAVRSDPSYVNAWINKAGRLQKALETYRLARRSFPQNASIGVNLAYALLGQSRNGEADALFEEIVHNHPSDTVVRIQWADSLRERGQWQGARFQYEKALEVDPANASAHNNLGVALGMLNNHVAAYSHFSIAVEQDPKNPDYKRNKAQAESLLQSE